MIIIIILFRSLDLMKRPAWERQGCSCYGCWRSVLLGCGIQDVRMTDRPHFPLTLLLRSASQLMQPAQHQDRSTCRGQRRQQLTRRLVSRSIIAMKGSRICLTGTDHSYITRACASKSMQPIGTWKKLGIVPCLWRSTKLATK